MTLVPHAGSRSGLAVAVVADAVETRVVSNASRIATNRAMVHAGREDECGYMRGSPWTYLRLPS